MGTVGLSWQVALRNTATGALGTVGLEWQLGGFAADPPTGAMGSSDGQPGSTSQLVQAMASFGGGAAAISNTAPSVPRHHNSNC